jgi:indolepyruvate ferredoxin oxidoreductase
VSPARPWHARTIDHEEAHMQLETANDSKPAAKSKSKAPSLADKFDLEQSNVLLTGSQAVVRLTLMQRARDERAGLNTAGFVTGYRGSPIAGLEGQFQRAAPFTRKYHVVFKPGLNEDLAATALWGAQQSELRGEGKYDGVFGIWYGKGPGVDRTGDAFRHANHAGTSKHGGVLALMGDDHTCESSTSAHQSEFAFLDYMMPVLNPAGVQEIIDYGLHGFAMSRFASVWVGIKCVKDNIESTTSVEAGLDRVQPVIPADFRMPEGGLGIRLADTALAKETRLHDHKRQAVLAYARANHLDRIVYKGGAAPKVGIITTGKSYLDTMQALEELGIDARRADEMGLRLMKVAMVWPLEPQAIAEFARGLDLIIVVEEKRALIETQVKEQLYDWAERPKVVGKRDESNTQSSWLFPAAGALEPTDIAIAVGERLLRYRNDEGIKSRIADLKRHKGNRPSGGDVAQRLPYFCAGCPHNSSTVVPKGSHAYAGIGCHFMAQWMDRNTEGFTQMGAEGANWIGEAPFSKRTHVFQNLGDGTYTHSGSLAIRAAATAGVNMTFKILYNDAVAMTGGQKLEQGITVPAIAKQVISEGSRRTVVVTDQPEKYDTDRSLPAEVDVYHRRELQRVQEDLAKIDGLTVLIYDQTCAAEKRRRRKRGQFPDPAKRAFINTAVCEGCGDCGVKSNCVAVQPVETELGRKRMIDQSACNKDYSCVEGFCPSFVTVHGGTLKKALGAASSGRGLDLVASLPEPKLPALDKPFSMIVTGVGGTGVVTVSAVLCEAAHIDGKGVGSIDMTGLAQKGGAVACHLRIAARQDQISAIRVGVAGADAVVGCDLVTTGTNKILETVRKGETQVTLNTHEQLNGDFARDADLRLPALRIKQAVEERAGARNVRMLDAHELSVRLFGDSIMSNMLMLGYAYQLGHVPIRAAAIETAIELNGAQIELNKRAFRFGRLAAHDAKALEGLLGENKAAAGAAALPLDEAIAKRKTELAAYQDEALAERFAARVARIREVEAKQAPGRGGLTEAVARGYHKLLAYKDEYEVARLFTTEDFKRSLESQFEGDYKLHFHLAPPLIARKDKTTGKPRKIELGSWMMPAFRLLARMKGLRGTSLDLFGYTAERRMERRLIGEYEAVLDEIERKLANANHAICVELASIPERMKGYGHVKHANVEGAKKREADLLRQLRSPAPTPAPQKMAAE